MANIEATLTKNSDSKEFQFRAVAPLQDRISRPVLTIPLINTGPDNTFLFAFTGQSGFISFRFAIFDDDVDVANGTHTSTVKTVSEQIEYLKTFFSSDFDESYTLVQERYAPSPGYSVVITEIVFDPEAGRVNVVTGSISMQRGRIGAL